MDLTLFQSNYNFIFYFYLFLFDNLKSIHGEKRNNEKRDDLNYEKSLKRVIKKISQWFFFKLVYICCYFFSIGERD